MKRKMHKSIITLLLILSNSIYLSAQTYREIRNWPEETNRRIESFLNSTLTINNRKVAVFDGDGTVLGQAPHYLADEALFRYADRNYKNENNKTAKSKMSILKKMVEDGNNVGKTYIEDRIHFLSGLSPDEAAKIGYDCYVESYRNKFYSEMKELIANLKEYDFEIWIITASPEFLYQKFLSFELGISETHIIGVKSTVVDGKLTDEIIPPIPQDDGKANVIPTFIKTSPLLVAGNSRGDLNMLNQSAGLKLIVNPDDQKIRGKEDEDMRGLTVKQYWKKQGALIIYCNDGVDPTIHYHTSKWGIRKNRTNLRDTIAH